MAHPTNHTENIESMGTFKPLSNAESSYSLPATASDLSPRAEAAMANGLSPDPAEEDHEGEADEDYVSVDPDDMNDFSYWLRRPPVHQHTKLDDLHPFVQALTVSNVDDCVAVENAFPENERCTREKFIYRLTKCPELSLGLFTIPIIPEGQPKPRPTLVGHIIATRSSTTLVTDNDMKLPSNWQKERIVIENGETIGHDENGSTIAIHSLAVLPEHQGKQVGSTLMKSYIQRIRDAAIARRISIIAHDHLVPFYESLGFESIGPSKCQFGGGGWTDLVSGLFFFFFFFFESILPLAIPALSCL
ncbi:polyamine acetyltransferase [Aspergillus clavatus NRRL 1]|uniref:GNAT family acetyltransferase, putative n=1 Tax=Aspergillus clavatus (strain ATCC 1007 / CBS 513.65 / DSM 816 / NCTC 3887 / NRRL 1 / QM 1276 / 107) TaxID=344612 RepID=A1C6J3_ASPCL|nr:GNAT family acetyltransferase, putative [Aspergillus clavatus NRRL 1]EAW14014.1 GNAT family acetyltransferase, putative [Aspergillus clavatus NRRL 1]